MATVAAQSNDNPQEPFDLTNWSKEQHARIALYGLQGALQQNQAATQAILSTLGGVKSEAPKAETGVQVPLSPQQVADLARVSPIGSTVNYTEQHFNTPVTAVDQQQSASEQKPVSTATPPANGKSVGLGTAGALTAAALLAGAGLTSLLGGNKQPVQQPGPPTKPPVIQGEIEYEIPFSNSQQSGVSGQSGTVVGGSQSSVQSSGSN